MYLFVGESDYGNIFIKHVIIIARLKVWCIIIDISFFKLYFASFKI